MWQLIPVAYPLYRNVVCPERLIYHAVVSTEERDEYDDEFDRMREANLKTRLVQAKDEYTAAVTTVEECRGKLSYAKQQVNTTARSSPLLNFLHLHKIYDNVCSDDDLWSFTP